MASDLALQRGWRCLDLHLAPSSFRLQATSNESLRRATRPFATFVHREPSWKVVEVFSITGEGANSRSAATFRREWFTCNQATWLRSAEAEIKNAWDLRFIDPLENGTGFAILGYSWGGGVTHDLIERLYNDSYFPTFAVYLDAVDHGTNFQETDWPTETFYLLNIWQPNGVLTLGGGPISNPEDKSPFSELEEIELTNEDHSSIDDDPFVHQRIKTRLDQNMIR